MNQHEHANRHAGTYSYIYIFPCFLKINLWKLNDSNPISSLHCDKPHHLSIHFCDWKLFF